MLKIQDHFLWPERYIYINKEWEVILSRQACFALFGEQSGTLGFFDLDGAPAVGAYKRGYKVQNGRIAELRKFNPVLINYINQVPPVVLDLYEYVPSKSVFLLKVVKNKTGSNIELDVI